AAPFNPCAWHFSAALCADLAFQLESAQLSQRALVLQSVRVAAAVRVRCLVRGGRSRASCAGPAVTRNANRRNHLSHRCILHFVKLVYPANEPFRPALARGADLPDR